MSEHAEPEPRPKPENFSDYRKYLKAMIAWLKRHQRGFSYASFAKKAGFSSKSFLKLVSEGQRNLSQASIGAFGRALGHKRRDQEIFEALVLLAQASSDAERNRRYSRLRKLRGKSASEAVQMERAQYDAYSHWYIIPIRELLLQSDFREDPEWIARQLRPPIRPSEAQKALEILQQVNLVARDEDGALKPRAVKLAATSLPVGPLAIRNYHRAMLARASEALDNVPADQRNLTSLTIRLSPEQYKDVCERIQEFRAELADLVEDNAASDGASDHDVFVLAFQLFPVTARGLA